MTPFTTGSPLTPERWAAFHALVRDVRQLQSLYRRTIDCRIRREMEKFEHELDAQVGWLAADLAAECAERQQAESLAEAAETAKERAEFDAGVLASAPLMKGGAS